jgi:hypothetical protein
VAVQADQAPVVGVARRKRRRSQLGLAGSIVVVGAAAAAVYLVMAPLLALLATAFRGPSDLLPFEPGAHWTFDNLVDVYVNTPLLSSVLPNTATFVAGSVAVTFLTAFTLAWLVEWRLIFPTLPALMLALAIAPVPLGPSICESPRSWTCAATMASSKSANPSQASVDLSARSIDGWSSSSRCASAASISDCLLGKCRYSVPIPTPARSAIR